MANGLKFPNEERWRRTRITVLTKREKGGGSVVLLMKRIAVKSKRTESKDR